MDRGAWWAIVHGVAKSQKHMEAKKNMLLDHLKIKVSDSLRLFTKRKRSYTFSKLMLFVMCVNIFKKDIRLLSVVPQECFSQGLGNKPFEKSS